MLIIHRGRLVADRTFAELSGSQEHLITVGFARSLSNGETQLGSIPGLIALEGPVSAEGVKEFTYRVRASRDIRREIFDLAAQKKLPLIELKMERKSLEEIFHELTR